ncbi:hypothetical protein [Nonomuraea glycinis]|uniref:hypothetical protein n=1 Tax=Nonomuraea glycinis TaxID=2047744 RepID=UPI0033AB76D2
MATASAAAFILPYASPIVGMMGLLVADPAEQDRGAEQWLNTTPIDAGPKPGPVGSPVAAQQEWRPPMAAPAAAAGSEHAAGASDLTYLRGELKRLTREIGNDKGWAGRSYKSFLEKVEVLDGHLATLDSNRMNCGNTLKCSAAGTHALVMFCVALSVALTALASYVLLLRSTASLAMLTGEAQAISVVENLHMTMKTVFTNHWKLVLKASAILGVAAIAYNQFTQDLPGLEAVSGAKPDLMEASVIWDPTKADMIDNPESQFDASKLEDSFMPEFGF